jgi:cellobiose phosphorylase
MVSNGYGALSPDGREFRITNPRTPRPWINLIANPRVGLAVSQTGSGFSWIDNSQLGAIVRWQQDLAEDRAGRFLYLADLESGRVGSLAPAPCWAADARFACRHGLGYTVFESEWQGLAAEWTLYVDPEATAELWRVRLSDRSGRPRRLALVPFLEWNCGVQPAPRREFQKLFLETEWRADARAVLAGSHMWDVASKRWGHWNTSFPYWSAFTAAQPVAAAQGDKAGFLGRYGDWRAPAALAPGEWRPRFGRHHDPVAALRCEIELAAGGAFDGGFVLSTAATREEALALAGRFAAPAALDCSRPIAWRRRSRASIRCSTTGCATRRSRRASGAAPATTSRAAPSASATSSRTPRSGSPSRPSAAASSSASTPRTSSRTARWCTGGIR